jgi:hypothetical protein
MSPASYCTDCGCRLRFGVRFCEVCGAPVLTPAERSRPARDEGTAPGELLRPASPGRTLASGARRRVASGLLGAIVVAALAVVGVMVADGGSRPTQGRRAEPGPFSTCGSLASRTLFNIEERGLTCPDVRSQDFWNAYGAVTGSSNERTVIIPGHEWRYSLLPQYHAQLEWLCYSRTLFSGRDVRNDPKLFDCTSGGEAELRWSAVPSAVPVELPTT